MADILNLRQARKSKARAEKEARAAANRSVHGQSRAEKLKLDAERQKADRQLDLHKRDRQTES